MAAITEENFGRYLFLYKMLPALKAKALEAGTAVNCDETWCRVRISDNGSRGRQILTDFLGCAEMSAIFHTFIETCKINGISTIEYFKKLLSELLTGNNNYAGLLPQTIGIKR